MKLHLPFTPTVDQLVNQSTRYKKIVIHGTPFIARPRDDHNVASPYVSWKSPITRLYFAWLVLTGKALAVQFTEDRYTKEDIKTATWH